MADRYWVGGSGTWSNTLTTNWSDTSGGAGGFSAPTSADNVIFDVNSNVGTTIFTVTLGTTPSCLNFSFGSGAQALDAVMTLAGSGVLNIYGNLTLVSSNLTVTAAGVWSFRSTSTGNTIDTAGKTIGVGGLTFNGVGGGWTLQGDLICGNSNNGLDIVAGNLDTNGFSVTTGGIQSIGTNTRSLTAGSSTFTFSTSFGSVNFGGSNFTFNCGTSTIISTNATQSLGFNGGGYTFYNVNFNGNTVNVTVAIRGANTFNNLTFATVPNAGIRTYTFDANQTINGTLTANGQDSTRRVLFASSIIGTQITLSINTFTSTLGGIDFRDIAVTGTAAPLSVNSMGNLGGNSGISFTVKTVYWNLTGTQNWNANAWATTSGGTPAVNNFPLAQDIAIINNAGAATLINVVANYAFPTIDFSTRTSAVTFSVAAICSLYGDYILGSGVTTTGTSTVNCLNRGTQNINGNGITVSHPFTINNITGTTQLSNNLLSSNTILTGTGTFNTNNFNVTAALAITTSSGFCTLNLGSSTFSVGGWNLASAFCALNAGTSNVVITSNAPTINASGLTFNKLTIGGAANTGTVTFTGANTFSELANERTLAYTMVFPVSAVTTIGTWSITGTFGNVVTVNSSAAGTRATLTINNKTSGINYLAVKDILSNLTPYTFFVNSTSTNNGNNLGVAFDTPTNVIYALTSGTSFTVPSNWNNTNIIHMIGAGGSGKTSIVSGNNRSSGGGGGGGGYTAISNFSTTAGSTINYVIGTAVNNASGNNTTWNSGAYIAGGGQAGTVVAGTTSTGGAGGIGSTYNGGAGGAGTFGTVVSGAYGSGGGGGAGGPNGVGGAGGVGFGSQIVDSMAAGGGGGGNGGGTAGGNASLSTGGTAGSGSSNGNGGAGVAGLTATNSGTSGTDIVNSIGGGGGGGGSANNQATNTALYGSGGSGGGVRIAGTTNSGALGTQGLIVIVYSATTPTPSATNGLFFGSNF